MWFASSCCTSRSPTPSAYEQHAELCRQVPGGTFRHGKVFGAPMGEPKFPYYAEWEFADMDAVQGGGAHRRVHGDRQGRDGDGHPVPRPLRRTSSERADASRPASIPTELGFERIVYEKAPPRATITLNRPERAERVRLPDAARARARVRGRVVGRRDPRRRPHRRGPRVLRRRRPPLVGRGATSATRRSTGSGSARSRTRTTGCARSASRRSRASTGSASAAATSCRWRATSR